MIVDSSGALVASSVTIEDTVPGLIVLDSNTVVGVEVVSDNVVEGWLIGVEGKLSELSIDKLLVVAISVFVIGICDVWTSVVDDSASFAELEAKSLDKVCEASEIGADAELNMEDSVSPEVDESSGIAVEVGSKTGPEILDGISTVLEDGESFVVDVMTGVT